MSRWLDNLTVLSQWDDDGAPHPMRTLRPRANARASQDPLGAEAALAPIDASSLRLAGTIGEGGMGVVRAATQVSLGREVAVKMVRPGQDRPEARRKVLHEGLITGALEHPNVVPVHDLRQDDEGRPLIVLKRIEGVPWSELIAHPERVRERFETGDVEDWNGRVLLQVCNAVAFAHARGVLHRDLKPENVMIGSFGEVYLLDWGLAVALPGCAIERIPRASDPRGVAGTPAYMAPEQVHTELPLGVHTDIWLLGAVLYEIVTGHPPYRAQEGLTGEQAVADVLRQAREGAVTVPDALPGPLQQLLRRSLCVDTTQRYPSVEAFRLELRRGLDLRQAGRLREEADRLLEGLLERLAEERPEPREILARLGAVRFAYRRVLQDWPDNERVRQSLDRALSAVARWHLAQGEVAAADVLLAEVSAPEPALTTAVGLAREEDRARLDRLRHAEDQAAGVRTRSFVISLMGGLWTVGLPLEVLTGHWPPTWTEIALSSVGLFVLGLGLGFWARDSLSRSIVNRQTRYIIALAPFLYGLSGLAAWKLGLPPDRAPILASFAYASMCGIQLRFGEMALLPPTLAFLAVFLGGIWWPATVPWALSLANLVFAVTLLRRGWTHLREAWEERWGSR
ncbi:MAG: serine/threonine protein kinase [Alphaproteobacteria bacterium]|nr:serine/threonine protein kinase [Alphaproteobacteria bacterium]